MSSPFADLNELAAITIGEGDFADSFSDSTTGRNECGGWDLGL